MFICASFGIVCILRSTYIHLYVRNTCICCVYSYCQVHGVSFVHSFYFLLFARSELYLTHIKSLARDYQLAVKRSLPLNTPLPLEPFLLFINLETNAYLVANIMWSNHTLRERFFILRVIPSTILPSVREENIPKMFFRVVSLVEVGVEKALTQLTGSLPGTYTHTAL